MGILLLTYAVWMAIVPFATPLANLDDLPRLITAAGVMGSLTVLVYRLGVWRQEMEHAKSNVGAELRSHREESTESFARIERHFEAFDHMIADYVEFKQQVARWHLRTTHRLERLEEPPE